MAVGLILFKKCSSRSRFILNGVNKPVFFFLFIVADLLESFSNKRLKIANQCILV